MFDYILINAFHFLPTTEYKIIPSPISKDGSLNLILNFSFNHIINIMLWIQII